MRCTTYIWVVHTISPIQQFHRKVGGPRRLTAGARLARSRRNHVDVLAHYRLLARCSDPGAFHGAFPDLRPRDALPTWPDAAHADRSTGIGGGVTRRGRDGTGISWSWPNSSAGRFPHRSTLQQSLLVVRDVPAVVCMVPRKTWLTVRGAATHLSPSVPVELGTSRMRQPLQIGPI